MSRYRPPARPTQNSLALAVCALGAGMLAMLLSNVGVALPVAMLIGLAVGVLAYIGVRALLVKRHT